MMYGGRNDFERELRARVYRAQVCGGTVAINPWRHPMRESRKKGMLHFNERRIIIQVWDNNFYSRSVLMFLKSIKLESLLNNLSP